MIDHSNAQKLPQRGGKKQSGCLILIYHSRINKTKTRKQQRTKRTRESKRVRGSDGGGNQSISSHFDMAKKEQWQHR